MFIDRLCTPSVIYVVFSLTHIIIEMLRRRFNTAFLKFVVMVVFTLLLNILCERGLRVVAWFIVFIPFIIMTFFTTLMMLTFGASFVEGEADDTTYSLRYH